MTKKNYFNIYFTKEGEGNDVLFLHGWGCNGNTFSSICARLKDYCVTKVDLWGFGNTPLPVEAENGWSVEDYADNLATFIQRQNYKNLTIVGHSFGGRIATVIASKYPHLLTKLVLVDSAGFVKVNFKKWLKVRRYKCLKFLAKISKKARNKVEQMGSDDFKACNGALRRTFVKVVNCSLEDFASKIKCPTLLIWGQKDKDTPLWMAKKFNKLIDNSGLVILKNCGHFCFLENSKLFLAVLKSFLSSGG